MAKLKIPISDLLPDSPPATGPVRKTHFSGKDRSQAFDSFFPCQWRGIGFPVSSMHLTITQDQAQHKYWGRNAAVVEATGRAPLEVEAQIPFVNGIAPGKNERWGLLYPTTWVEFQESFTDPSTGILDTPEFAGLTCKPVSLDYTIDPQVRDGVIATARWIETVDLDLDSGVRVHPLDGAQSSVLSLEAMEKDLSKVPDFEDPTKSFERLVNEFGGFFDTVASRVNQLQNKPSQILYRLEKFQDSVTRAKNALLWPAEEACEFLKEALHDLNTTTVVGTGPEAPAAPTQAARTPARPIFRYVTKGRTTLSMLQSLLPGNTTEDLIFLNPRLIARPVVGQGTVVRHYK